MTSETADIVVVLDFDPVPSWRQILIDHSVKLAEVWETSRSHPDNEVFYNVNWVKKSVKFTYGLLR